MLETAVGKVAMLLVGLSQVSSVVFTAEVGVELHKGQECGYFQFGGSDVVVLYGPQAEVHFTAQKGGHYQQGQKIAVVTMQLKPDIYHAP